MANRLDTPLQQAIEQCALVVENYGQEGNGLSKEYAHEMAAELAARLRALKNAAPQVPPRRGDDVRDTTGSLPVELPQPASVAPAESNMLWATVRLVAEVSDWKRDNETLVEWADRTLRSIRSETRSSAKLPSLPEEIQEWCWHMDQALDQDPRHKALALAAAWPHVSEWLRANVRPSDNAGVPFKSEQDNG